MNGWSYTASGRRRWGKKKGLTRSGNHKIKKTKTKKHTMDDENIDIDTSCSRLDNLELGAEVAIHQRTLIHITNTQRTKKKKKN